MRDAGREIIEVKHDIISHINTGNLKRVNKRRGKTGGTRSGKTETLGH